MQHTDLQGLEKLHMCDTIYQKPAHYGQHARHRRRPLAADPRYNLVSTIERFSILKQQLSRHVALQPYCILAPVSTIEKSSCPHYIAVTFIFVKAN